MLSFQQNLYQNNTIKIYKESIKSIWLNQFQENTKNELDYKV